MLLNFNENIWAGGGQLKISVGMGVEMGLRMGLRGNEAKSGARDVDIDRAKDGAANCWALSGACDLDLG